MALLKKCLEHENGHVRRLAAWILASGTSGGLAKEAVESIGKALNAVADIPGVDGLSQFGHGTESTWGEFYYADYIHTLAVAKIDDSTIRDLTKQLQGRAKDAAFLVLARRIDKSVHEELIRLAQDTEAGLFRAWAAWFLGEIGTQDDLPFLRTLAENDPLLRTGGIPGDPGETGPMYPVRRAAEDAIRMIEARESKEEVDE